MSTAPVLVFGWGNPSRGDDALGPLFIEAVQALALPGVDCLLDFQLQVQHVLDLAGRSRILFVDAAAETVVAPDQAFALTKLSALADASLTTHAMSPAALLQTYAQVEGVPAAPAWQLAIRGTQWGLGQAPSASALDNLRQALQAFSDWLASAESSGFTSAPMPQAAQGTGHRTSAGS